MATSTVAYAEARAALARKEREGEFIHEQHRRAVGALDVEWRGFVRLIVSNLVAYRAGKMAERYSLRGSGRLRPLVHRYQRSARCRDEPGVESQELQVDEFFPEPRGAR